MIGTATRRRRRTAKGPARRRWPTAEALLASRIRAASPGPARAALIGRLAASIGERVEPGPPAADSWARDRWEDRRRAELLGQLEVLRFLYRPD